MTQLKIRPVGDSLGIVLPKAFLLRLNLKDGDVLQMTDAPDGSMQLTACDPDFDKQMRIAQDGMRAYRDTLSELAK